MSMRILIKRGFCLEAGRDVQPGDVVEVDDRRAALLIWQGRAQPCAEPEEQPKERKKNANRSIL